MKRLLTLSGGGILCIIILALIFGRNSNNNDTPATDAGTSAVEQVNEALNITPTMQDIENQVAADAVKQYEIAKRNGSAIDAFSAASMVCAAYLQAKDEANYKKWKEIEKQEAQLAGMGELAQ